MRRFAKTILMLIAALALLASVGCGDSTGKVDENIKNIQIEPKPFVKKDASIFLPEISGLKNEDLQKKINTNLQTAILELVSKYEQRELSGDYRIVFLNDRLLTVIFAAGEDSSGELLVYKGFPVDLTTGKIYEPAEIFKKSSNYTEEILKLTRNAPNLRIDASTGSDWDHETFKRNWDSNRQKQFFLLTKDYLWVYTFASPKKMLVPGYGIPYDELEHLLDPGSNLWKAYKSGKNRAQDFDQYIPPPDYETGR